MKNYIMDYIYFFRDFSLHIILHSNPLPHGPVSLFIRARSVTVRSGEGSDEGKRDRALTSLRSARSLISHPVSEARAKAYARRVSRGMR